MLTRRSISRIRREPESLLDVTLQPVIFVLLFTYVFGSAIKLPGGGSYHQYLISGMFGMTMAGSGSDADARRPSRASTMRPGGAAARLACAVFFEQAPGAQVHLDPLHAE